jgi:hypothetical protein
LMAFCITTLISITTTSVFDIVILSVIMLSVIMLSVIMLNVGAPFSLEFFGWVDAGHDKIII